MGQVGDRSSTIAISDLPIKSRERAKRVFSLAIFDFSSREKFLFFFSTPFRAAGTMRPARRRLWLEGPLLTAVGTAMTSTSEERVYHHSSVSAPRNGVAKSKFSPAGKVENRKQKTLTALKNRRSYRKFMEPQAILREVCGDWKTTRRARFLSRTRSGGSAKTRRRRLNP